MINIYDHIYDTINKYIYDHVYDMINKYIYIYTLLPTDWYIIYII